MLKKIIEMVSDFIYYLEDVTLLIMIKSFNKKPHYKKQVEAYALQYAAKHGRYNLLVRLHQLGISLDQLLKDGSHPLMVAIKYRNPSVVATLLEFGIDPDLNHHNFDVPPLQLATQAQHPGIIGALISCGADIRAKSYQSMTMIDFAASWKNVFDTQNQQTKQLFDIIKPHLFPIAENLCNTIGYGSSQARQVLLLAIQKQYHSFAGTNAGKRLMDHFAKETMALLIA